MRVPHRDAGQQHVTPMSHQSLLTLLLRVSHITTLDNSVSGDHSVLVCYKGLLRIGCVA